MTMKSFPVLNDASLEDAVEKLLHWSLVHGLVMYPTGFKSFNTNAAPVTLFPTPFPRDGLNAALNVQTLFNELYAKVATDEEWLSLIMDELIDVDKEFTGKLWQTHKRAKEIGISQPLSLSLVRSDYMLDENTGKIKQIEYNAISVSFGGLSPKVSDLHRYLNHAGAYDSRGSQKYYEDGELATTEASDKLVEGFNDAVKLYNGRADNNTTIVLVVVQENERNVFDQRHLEYALLNNHGIKSQRATLSEVSNVTRIDSESKKIYYIPTGDEISVIYYRTGYSPSDYSSEADWETRLQLETSKAIKCPTLLSQLSGAKKIQQLLTDRELVSKYISKSNIDTLFSKFVDIWPLDNSELGKKAKKLAFECPEKFVLKPQREGGGNNIYKEDIPGFLSKLPEDKWNAYILMDLISPSTHKNTVIREDKLYTEDVVSELGIFGTIIWDSGTGEIKSNKTADYLLRSKFSSSNEGGVAAGFGCVDSLYLY
ncbi:glutathione synthase [Saccharomycopsis crataegensis]|uniref:Glutathione synthetase n=1 Tax=Saccharomycopsis crataegensis TaxID=43959 RepID=A0AAV5QW60_9ASCO|nr:glutathione synthase [Saccharomycopsis crataegensis]